MELTGPALDAGERYKKIVADTARLDALLVDLFLDWHGEQPERIVLDVDATDGTVEELERIVGRIQKRWPGVAIWLRRGQRVLPRRIAGLVRGAGSGVCAGNRAGPALETEPGAGAGPAGMRADGAVGAGVQGLPATGRWTAGAASGA